MATITTYTGHHVDPFNLRPDDINVEDIAHSLSMQCRYAGHVDEFYSISDHSIRVSEIVSDQNKLWALLHDASEAYLSDIPGPIKKSPLLAGYRKTEALVMTVICERFDLPVEEPEEVRRADKILLATELRDLMAYGDEAWAGEPALAKPIRPLPISVAEQRFLYRFDVLVKDRVA